MTPMMRRLSMGLDRFRQHRFESRRRRPSRSKLDQDDHHAGRQDRRLRRATTGTSGSYDRHLYMDNSGHIIFGVYTGHVHAITARPVTTTAPGTSRRLSDEHQGMTLYIDGKKIGLLTRRTTSASPTGLLADWWGQPRWLAERARAATTSPARSMTSRSTLRQSAWRSCSSTTSTVDGRRRPSSQADRQLRQGCLRLQPGPVLALDEANGTDRHGQPPNGADGTYTGGVTFGTAGGVAGTTDTAATFNGSTGSV